MCVVIYMFYYILQLGVLLMPLLEVSLSLN